LAQLLTEAFCYLFHQGLIAPYGEEPLRMHQYCVTVRGLAWAKGSEPIPEDCESFMVALKSLMPNLDSVVEQYVREALIVFERQAYFAAAVMIGAAAEKAVYMLVDSLVKQCRIHGRSDWQELCRSGACPHSLP
jgi:hypothetical protein